MTIDEDVISPLSAGEEEESRIHERGKCGGLPQERKGEDFRGSKFGGRICCHGI